MKVALLQLCSGDDPEVNLPVLNDMIVQAAEAGAELILTPEVTNCVSGSRPRQAEVLQSEAQDITLSAVRKRATELGLWINIGSLALKGEGTDDRFINRSFLIDPQGAIRARYDKIHMFDVSLASGERYRESAGYRPGGRAVVAQGPGCRLGLTICYDLRFPYLHRALAQAGADLILVPSAFSQTTGAAHWDTLLRARAIETGSFILAAAQTGEHPSSTEKSRRTYGHSLAVNPWGKVLADAGDAVGVTLVDLDLAEVAKARGQIPALTHDRPFKGP